MRMPALVPQDIPIYGYVYQDGLLQVFPATRCHTLPRPGLT